jgi:hypothetical protein
MLTIDFSDVNRFVANLDSAGRQLPFVTAVALTNAMKDARTAEISEMQRVFDRPTRYTLNSIQVVPATKAKLVAELRFKEFGGTPADKYLGPEVRGGPRAPKGFERALRAAGILWAGEFAVPGPGAKLDAYGNLSGGQITRILSALGASRDASQNTRRRPRLASRRRNLDYFVLRGARAPAGVYLRVGRRGIPVLFFVRAPTYRPRYPFYEVGRKVVPAAFARHFRAAWQRYVVNDLKRGRRA